MHKALLQSPPKIRSSTSANFHLTIISLLVHNTILTMPTSISFLYSSVFASPPYFCAKPSLQSKPKEFFLSQPFSQYRLCQGDNEPGNLVRTSTTLISSFFLEVRTGKTRLAISDSLLVRLRKRVCLRSKCQTIQSTFSIT